MHSFFGEDSACQPAQQSKSKARRRRIPGASARQLEPVMFRRSGTRCGCECGRESRFSCHCYVALIEVRAVLSVRISKKAYRPLCDGFKLLFGDCYFSMCIFIRQCREDRVGDCMGADFDAMLCEVDDHFSCEHELVPNIAANQFFQFSS